MCVKNDLEYLRDNLACTVSTFYYPIRNYLSNIDCLFTYNDNSKNNRKTGGSMITYKVLRPCVIESEYYDIGDIYKPSKHMSDKALGCLLFFNFLDEIDTIKIEFENDEKVKQEIYQAIDYVLSDARILYGAAGTKQAHIYIQLQDNLNGIKGMVKDLL